MVFEVNIPLKYAFPEIYKHANQRCALIHSVTKPVLILCRVCGVFPVSGSFSCREKLRFKLKSRYFAICIFLVIIQMCLAVACLIYLGIGGITLRNCIKLLVQASGFTCSLNILCLARKWPIVATKAAHIEKRLIQCNHKNIPALCKFIVAVMICGTVLDFGLGVNFYIRMSYVCYNGNLAESYYRYTMPSLASIMPYSPWSFYPLMIISVQTAFVIQISDMLIVITGIYLSSHIDDLYDLTLLYKDKYPSMWHVIRGHHSSLVRLVRLLDGTVSPFVLVSFGSNLSLICVQLYKILEKTSVHGVTDICDKKEFLKLIESYHRAAFYVFSELLVVMRTLASALFAAKVHLAAQKPLQILYDVPSHCFTLETRRFIDQILSTKVAMSGFHFFYVTRGMIITMIATVITYELVLFQLD